MNIGQRLQDVSPDATVIDWRTTEFSRRPHDDEEIGEVGIALCVRAGAIDNHPFVIYRYAEQYGNLDLQLEQEEVFKSFEEASNEWLS